jgi:hypothetical protein
MKPAWTAAAAALLSLPLAGRADGPPPADAAKEKPRMTGPSISRPSAPQVADIDHQGVRYVQDKHDSRNGDQPGGYLAAIDIASGQRLWRLKVYEVPDGRAAGQPTLPRYFRSMQLVPGGQALEIVNEAGGVYRVDLATRTATQVGGPPASAPPQPKLPPKAAAD